MLEALAQREIVLVTGKGGTGKSTLAAVLARGLAARGRRVLLLEVDPRESCFRLLGVPPSGGEILPAGEGLWIQNLRSRDVLDELVRERVRIEPLVRRVLESPVYRHFAEGAPGLSDLALLGHALRVRRRLAPGAPPADVVVLDAPATGHALSLLRAPALVAAAVTTGPFGEMSRELARVVADPAALAVVLVALAEEIPVSEALESARELTAEGRAPAAVLVNRLWPELPPGGAPSDLESWSARRTEQDRELARLAAAGLEPLWELPLLPLAPGPELVRELGRRLDSRDEASR